MGRFDISIKTLGDSLPRTFVRLFGRHELDDTVELTPVDREVVTPAMAMDHAYEFRRGGESFIEHFESEIVLTEEDSHAIVRKGLLLAAAKWLPVWTTIILLARRNDNSARLPSIEPAELGSYTVHKNIRIVRLWEFDPALVLADREPEVLPIVGGMAHSMAAIEEVIRRLREVTDIGLRARLNAEFLTWISVNYNRDVVAATRERLSMVTQKDLWMASPIGEELMTAGREIGIKEGEERGRKRGEEEGRKQGEERGRKQGEEAATRSFVVEIATSRFPGIIDNLSLDSLDLPALRQLSRSLLRAGTYEEARSILAVLPVKP